MSADPDEHSLIATVLQHRPSTSRHPAVARAIARPGDDAVLVGDGTVVAVDAMVQGIHWDARSAAADVGFKLAAVNASDIGAMGCLPTWALLALSVPKPAPADWVEGFARGLGLGLETWGAQLVGGDTTASPGPIVVSLTMAGVGRAPIGREGARPGQDLWVTGTLGDAAAGFFHGDDAGLDWLRRPRPPVGFGAALADAGLVTAMMDLSDGLSTDLARMCKASGCGARVFADRLPASPAIAALPASQRLSLQVAFGDDYQLLFAAEPAQADHIESLASTHDQAVRCIGQLTRAPAVALDCGPWPTASFGHFATPGAS